MCWASPPSWHRVPWLFFSLVSGNSHESDSHEHCRSQGENRCYGSGHNLCYLFCPRAAASFFGGWESAGFSGASGSVHLGSENSPWTPPVSPQCQNLSNNKLISYNGFVGCSLPSSPQSCAMTLSSGALQTGNGGEVLFLSGPRAMPAQPLRRSACLYRAHRERNVPLPRHRGSHSPRTRERRSGVN